MFDCHIKERNKKILINFDEIRLILKKIFYYRKSAVEIFTEAKSYFFNFYEEKSLIEFMKLFLKKIKNMYYPIYNNNDLLGYIKFISSSASKTEISGYSLLYSLFNNI